MELSQGQFLRGHVDNDTKRRRFMGVPFAAPPVGDNRWRGPLPAEEWRGVREAIKMGNSCLQSDSVQTLGSDMSEDCLYLNVYAPPKQEEEKGGEQKGNEEEEEAAHAVMVFFYGGSWSTGTSTCPVYYGDDFVANSNNSVVLVTVNYRFNGFGFLGADALRDDSDAYAGSTGNWGLLDQRAALRWVQANAAAFGGDPSKVTIFGESAGAGSVAVHLASRRSFAAADGPLFSARVLESGSPATPWNSQNMTHAEARARTYADFLNCSDGSGSTGASGTAAPVTASRWRACVRGRRRMCWRRGGDASWATTWSPVEDGVELVEPPRDTLAKVAADAAAAVGDGSGDGDGDGDGELILATNVTILLGSNGDEGSEFTDSAWDSSEAEYEAYMASLFGGSAPDDLAAKVLAQYRRAPTTTRAGRKRRRATAPSTPLPGHWATPSSAARPDRPPVPGQRRRRLFPSRRYRWTAVVVAAAVAAAAAAGSSSSGGGGGAFLYFFNRTLEALMVVQDKDLKMQPPPYDQMGVFHGSELGWVFDVKIALDFVRMTAARRTTTPTTTTTTTTTTTRARARNRTWLSSSARIGPISEASTTRAHPTTKQQGRHRGLSPSSAAAPTGRNSPLAPPLRQRTTRIGWATAATTNITCTSD